MVKDSLKPCLVQTSQGFSVNYKERLLYSKYNPQKSILTLIQNINILPGTIILCISPALNYGLPELVQKLPEDCCLFGIDAEPGLLELSKSDPCRKLSPDFPFTHIPAGELLSLPEKISALNNGRFRRCIRIDFSGGFAFHSEFYQQLYAACQNTVAQFWKNRITLVKFGRRYAGNILKNLPRISKSRSFKKVKRPIAVIGAGESAVKTLESIKQDRSSFYILAVDAVLQTLKAMNIKADAVICEEAQDLIAGAFTGALDSADRFFVSASTNPNVTKLCPGKNAFYATEYAETNFFKRLRSLQILENIIPPLGSVGLSAVELALKIRADDSVPVFVSGLDFSFSCGQTHAKNSFHEKNRRTKNCRLSGLENFASSFSPNAKPFTGKDGRTFYTTTPLSGYAELFAYRYTGTKNLFDAGKSGIPLGLEQKDIEAAGDIYHDNERASAEGNLSSPEKNKLRDKKITEFINEEKCALQEIKDIFTGRINLSPEESQKRLAQLLSDREYLYLHFPDGCRLDFSQDFLNRVRIELDYFLKILN